MSGTIISIVLGIAGIISTYFIARWQMKKNQIDHYFINSYDIGKGLTDDFPGFALHYNGEILSKNVNVIKGGFINIGRNDIGNDGKTTYIKILFPKGFVVKAIKIFSKGTGLIVKANVDDNDKIIIIFSINGLMKSKEWFNYTAIIEVPDDIYSLYNQLYFEHRIKNTIITDTYIGPIGRYKEKQDKLSMYLTILLVFFISLLVIYLIKPDWLKYFQIRSSLALLLCFIIVVGMPYIMDKYGKRGRIIKALSKKRNN